MRLGEAVDCLEHSRRAGEAGAGEGMAPEETETGLHLMEPGGIGRREMEPSCTLLWRANSHSRLGLWVWGCRVRHGFVGPESGQRAHMTSRIRDAASSGNNDPFAPVPWPPTWWQTRCWRHVRCSHGRILSTPDHWAIAANPACVREPESTAFRPRTVRRRVPAA